MTQDEIIRMAREACAPNQTFNSDEEWVKRFAALVAAHEREACAEVCEEVADDYRGLQYDFCGNNLAEVCAADIRSRSDIVADATARGEK